MWIIHFYSEEQILKLKEREKIIISIDSNNSIIIYSFIFENMNKNDILQINKQKKVDIEKSEKIIRLDKCFNPKDFANNYFLIGTHFNNKAIIIKISHDYKNIEQIQNIDNNDCTDGLLFAYEFKNNNNFYLLHNRCENFSVWYYDEKSNKLQYEIVKPHLNNFDVNIINNKTTNRFKTINYVKNKSIFIIHATIGSSHYLLFYKVDEQNKTLKDINITLIGNIALKNENNIFSPVYNNCCTLNDKFLLISSQYKEIEKEGDKEDKEDKGDNKDKKDEKKKEDKENLEVRNVIEDKKKSIKFGGIYLISLEKLEIIRYFTFDKCRFVNSCLFYKNNIFICNFAQFFYKNGRQEKRTIYKLLLFQLIDDNETGKKKVIKKKVLTGNYSLINSNSMLLYNYIISSNGKYNSLIKVIKDEKLTVCGNVEIKKEE